MRASLLTFVIVATLTPAFGAAQQPATPRPTARPPMAARGALADGEVTFKAICSTCHSLTPPVKLAPPMAMVSKHYRDAFTDERQALDAMTRFILTPDSLKMTMPKHAMERFGLMPRIPLSEQQARNAATYVWSLSAAK